MGAPRTSSSDRRVRSLGRGAFGEVELVVRSDGRFERLFAKKRLLPAHQEDAELRSMFFEEARLAGMIRHPNVVSVLDVGEDEQGPYLLMDYVEGVSLHRLIEVSRMRHERLPLQVCLRLVAQVAEGLHAAHELHDREGRPLGLVHRDVSPVNVLLGYDGTARVTDFGVARALGRTTKTSTGFLKGKLGYMSPEQLRFEEPDRRSDLFALGVVLFELIVLERLYVSRDGQEGPRRILTEPPPDLADHRDDVPDALVQLMFSLLAKDREHRPRDAKAVALTLEQLSAALTLEEGHIDLAGHLAELLEHERAQAQREHASALAALSEVAPAAEVPSAAAAPVAAPRTRGLHARTLGVIGAVGLAAALALVLARAMPERAPSTTTTAAIPAAALGEPAAAEDEAREAARDEAREAVKDEAREATRDEAREAAKAETRAPSTPAPSVAAGEGEASRAPRALAKDTPASEPTARPAAATTEPKRRARRPKPSPSAGVPMWSW
jgi:hypothetical protein